MINMVNFDIKDVILIWVSIMSVYIVDDIVNTFNLKQMTLGMKWPIVAIISFLFIFLFLYLFEKTYKEKKR